MHSAHMQSSSRGPGMGTISRACTLSRYDAVSYGSSRAPLPSVLAMFAAVALLLFAGSGCSSSSRQAVRHTQQRHCDSEQTLLLTESSHCSLLLKSTHLLPHLWRIET